MDLTDLEQILNHFESSSLSDLELSTAAFSLTLRRSPGSFTPTKISEPQEKPELKSELSVITSPIVGTFYLTPAPDAPPYVTEGSVVEPGSPICTIEAMKMMNQLEAEYACEIVSIRAQHGAMVEFGQPLFEVKRQ